MLRRPGPYQGKRNKLTRRKPIRNPENNASQTGIDLNRRRKKKEISVVAPTSIKVTSINPASGLLWSLPDGLMSAYRYQMQNSNGAITVATDKRKTKLQCSLISLQ